MTDPPPFPVFPPPPPLIAVVSGPSGVGKNVICDRLLAEDPSLVYSVSATTRPPRPEEKEGVDYYFWTRDRFRTGIDQDRFLEWAQVHGHLYGTPREPLQEHMAGGRSPLLNVDVQGGRSVKTLRPDAVLVMIAPPSMKVLEERLRGRGTEKPEVLRERLANARRELAEWRHYDYAVVNDDLALAVSRIQAILGAERARVSRLLAGEPPATS